MTKKRHRRHSIPFKKMIVEAYFNGAALNALSVEHDVCRHLIRTWIEKYEPFEIVKRGLLETATNIGKERP